MQSDQRLWQVSYLNLPQANFQLSSTPCSSRNWVESYSVGNLEDRFSQAESYFIVFFFRFYSQHTNTGDAESEAAFYALLLVNEVIITLINVNAPVVETTSWW